MKITDSGNQETGFFNFYKLTLFSQKKPAIRKKNGNGIESMIIIHIYDCFSALILLIVKLEWIIYFQDCGPKRVRLGASLH